MAVIIGPDRTKGKRVFCARTRRRREPGPIPTAYYPRALPPGPEAGPNRAACTMIDDLWYKNGVFYYCLSVGTYMDANGDGIGDFTGIVAPVGLSAGPWYHHDLADAVPPAVARQGRWLRYLRLLWREPAIRHAGRLRRIHPWLPATRHPRHHRPSSSNPHLGCASVVFEKREARRTSEYRDWYVWSDRKPANADKGMVFPGVQKSTWTHDKEAKAWYFHRFSTISSPTLKHLESRACRPKIFKIMGFWIQPTGVSGFRMDAGPVRDRHQGRKGPQAGRAIRHAARVPGISAMAAGQRHQILGEGQRTARNRSGIFRPGRRDRIQMMFNFQVNQHLFYAMARSADSRPLAKATGSDENPRPRHRAHGGACSCAITSRASISAG